MSHFFIDFVRARWDSVFLWAVKLTIGLASSGRTEPIAFLLTCAVDGTVSVVGL